MGGLRVFVADDHAIVRDGLKKLLEDTNEFVFAGACSDGNELLRLLPDAAWDVLVLDLSLPSRGGVELLRQVRALRPGLPVVILSAYPEEQYAPRMFREGAQAYVAKGEPTEELLTALRTVAQGKRYVPARQAPYVEAKTEKSALPHDALTAREHQVFVLLAQGKSPMEIATDLNLSPSTVSTHIAHVRQKLHAQTVGEVVQYAFRFGLVQ